MFVGEKGGEVGMLGMLEGRVLDVGWDGMEYGRWYGVDCDGLMA